MPIPSNDWAIRLRPFAPLLVIALAVLTGYTRGLGLALLVLAAGALLLAIGLVWQSVQSLNDEGAMSLDEALALGAPSAEEERKRSVLRALKDLEYERSVGKVSEEDYAKLSAQYREEARRLLQLLEGEHVPARERAEKLLQKRLDKVTFEAPKKAKAPPPKPAEEEDEGEDAEEPAEAAKADEDEDTAPAAATESDEADDEDASDDEASTEDEDEGDEGDEGDDDETAAKKCEECETLNDPDARFCKSCGERFE